MRVIVKAVTVEQLRRAQAVVLPLLRMSLEQTAVVTGLSVGWVSKQRNRFIQAKAQSPLVLVGEDGISL